MPLQNRADPSGELHAERARGLFTGNRGVIHDPDKRALTGRRWTTQSWIICDCGFRGRKRDVFGRNLASGGAGWTNLFFMDEVTALSAGHRPCFECRREKAREFAECFGKAHGVPTPKALEMDHILHGQRELSARRPPRMAIKVGDAPDGAMFRTSDGFAARREGKLLRWSFRGWTEEDNAERTLVPVTPEATLAALGAGYLPVWGPPVD